LGQAPMVVGPGEKSKSHTCEWRTS
jgi:hypothetical protein